MSVKRLVGEPREKRLSADGIMFPVTVPVSAAEGMLAVEDATAVLMRPEISESVAYCESVVVETYPERSGVDEAICAEIEPRYVLCATMPLPTKLCVPSTSMS